MEETLRYEQMPSWKLIEIAARELARKSPDGTFTRKQIIDYINKVLLRGHNPRKPSSLNPVIQAVTANAPGGAPSGIGKNILWRVSRGRYRLFDPGRDKPIPEKTPGQLAELPYRGRVLEVGPGGALTIPPEVLRALKVKAHDTVVCHIRGDELVIRPVPDIRSLLREEPEVRISIEEFLAHRRELSKRLEA